MRHIRFFTIAFLLLGTFLLSGSAFADDAMVFIGPGGNNLGGVYTYPYNFTVNGTPQALICDSFSNEVQSGETWTATEHFFNPSSNALFGSTASQNYLAAGLIFDSILGINGISKTAFSSTVSSDDANWAIWALFNGAAKTAIQTGDGTHFASGDANAFLIYTNALTLAATVTNTSSDFNGIVIYTPVSGTQKKPLEFGPAPRDIWNTFQSRTQRTQLGRNFGIIRNRWLRVPVNVWQQS